MGKDSMIFITSSENGEMNKIKCILNKVVELHNYKLAMSGEKNVSFTEVFDGPYPICQLFVDEYKNTSTGKILEENVGNILIFLKCSSKYAGWMIPFLKYELMCDCYYL